MILRKILSLCLELLFPPHCVFCDKVLAPGTKICKTCAETVVPVRALRCMNPSGSGQNIPCIVLYFYDAQVRDSIIRFKFYGEKSNADFYAEQLSKWIGKQMPPLSFDFVTAVPISRERKKQRGYNQSELIARKLAAGLGIPYEECLEKVVDNREQHRLPRRERMKNVTGVYRASGDQVPGKRILLLDDIVTTGATLCECAEVLLNAGAKVVTCAAVAQVNKESC
ncbi:MAG: ComF family protein [Oscillospiraceae bacterium]|jgi:ComF family protein|nr:ComF family protein [Oscillospiraceae bacterium]